MKDEHAQFPGSITAVGAWLLDHVNDVGTDLFVAAMRALAIFAPAR